MKHNRVVSSILNALVTVISSILTSVLSLISTKLILQYYGSDFNGLIATGNQLINVLLIVEGGVTLAINVSLFKPFVNKMYEIMNSIMSAAKKIYIKIGLILLIVGILSSIFFSFFIKSEVDKVIIFIVFFLIVLSSAFNIGYIVKYRIMYQVSQTEYKINTITIGFNILSSTTYIILLLVNANIIVVRFSLLFFSIMNGLLIIRMFKHDFAYVSFNQKEDYSSLNGTKDIMIQKVLNVLYTTSPIMFISTFMGTVHTSIYAVYYSIYNIIKMFLQSIVSAPVNGFGQLLIEEKNRAKEKYIQYEFVIIFITTCLLVSLLIVIVPFIELYTAKINDANYVNYSLAILMAIILYLEIIHLPAGNIINISGNFKAAKNIQILSSIILVFLMTLCGFAWGLTGVLVSLFITNIFLCILEIGYVYKIILNISIRNFLRYFLPNMGIVFLAIIVSVCIPIHFDNYMYFFLVGLLLFIIIVLLTSFINYIFNKQTMIDIINMISVIVNRGSKR